MYDVNNTILKGSSFYNLVHIYNQTLKNTNYMSFKNVQPKFLSRGLDVKNFIKIRV